MVLQNNDLFAAVACLASESICPAGISKAGIERRKKQMKSLYPNFEEILLNRINERHVALVWKSVCVLIRSILHDGSAAILPNFIAFFPGGSIRFCEDFEMTYTLKHVEPQISVDEQREFQTKEVDITQLSLMTKLSKHAIRFFLGEITFCVGMFIKENEDKFFLDLGSIGRLEAEHQIVKFISENSERKSHEPEREEKSTTMFGLTTDDARALAVSGEAQPLFFKNPFANERKLPGPLNDAAIDDAFQRQKQFFQDRLVRTLEEDESLRNMARKKEELRKRQERLRRKQLSEVKNFHQQQMEINSQLREQKRQEEKQNGIVVEEQLLPLSLFGSFKGAKQSKRKIMPFPIDQKATGEEVARIRQTKLDLFNALSAQLEQKVARAVSGKQASLLAEKEVSESTMQVMQKEESQQKLESRRKQAELREQWKKQLEFTTVKKLLNESDNGLLHKTQLEKLL